jgi:hypothetical protein
MDLISCMSSFVKVLRQPSGVSATDMKNNLMTNQLRTCRYACTPQGASAANDSRHAMVVNEDAWLRR